MSNNFEVSEIYLIQATFFDLDLVWQAFALKHQAFIFAKIMQKQGFHVRLYECQLKRKSVNELAVDIFNACKPRIINLNNNISCFEKQILLKTFLPHKRPLQARLKRLGKPANYGQLVASESNKN